MIPRYAVIATHNRPDELALAVAALAPQCDTIVIIDNASTPAVGIGVGLIHPPTSMAVLRDEEQPPNLSRLWNVGLDWCAAHARDQGADTWDVAIVNDDAVPPPDWYGVVSRSMRDHEGAQAACSDPHGLIRPGETAMYRADASANIFTRLAGWAFILRGETGLRFDERFRWWCGDDDMSMQARRAGGLVHVGGYPVENTKANSSTVGVLAEQAAKDMQSYVDKWGCRPW